MAPPLFAHCQCYKANLNNPPLVKKQLSFDKIFCQNKKSLQAPKNLRALRISNERVGCAPPVCLVSNQPEHKQPARASVRSMPVRFHAMPCRCLAYPIHAPPFKRGNRWGFESGDNPHLVRLGTGRGMHKATGVLAGNEAHGQTLGKGGTVLEFDFFLRFHRDISLG
jgi:hypothetical protein